MTRLPGRWATPAILACAAWGSIAHAQDFDRIAPKLPPVQVAPPPNPPAPTLPVGGSSQVVSPRLNGVVFVSGGGALALNGPAPGDAGPSGIAAPGLPLLRTRQFQDQIRPFLGKPATLADLARIAAITRAWYKSQRRPFVDVTVPPQNISGGVVQIVVTEYRLGKIEVSGNRYFSTALVEQTSGLEPGQTIDLGILEGDLNRLNQNPFLSVDAVFRPGAAAGETDVQLQAKDRLPLRVYAGYDNEGVRNLGAQELNLGVNWGNAFGTGQILSYQFNRSVSGRFTAHSVSDVIALPWQDKLLIFGSFETETPYIANGFKDIGHSGQASIRYVRALPGPGWLTQDLQLGYDFKATDNNLEFSGVQIFGKTAELDQFPLIYDGTVTDRYGQTSIQNILVESPGGITAGNNNAALRSLVPGSAARYLYDRLAVTRTTRLPAGFSSVTRAIVQGASGNLPDSEQLGGGGVGSVRGYFTDTALGSKGELLSQELRLPAFSPTRLWSKAGGVGDLAQFGLFYDYADLHQVQPEPDIPNTADLASAGFLLHYTLSRFVDIQFDMGWRLRKTPADNRHGAYGEVAAVFGF
jgi:hemolysin activation/secretion protein